jgi:methyl-accepting chemotaxis protein
MKLFKNMKIGTKLIFSIITVVVITLLVIAFVMSGQIRNLAEGNGSIIGEQTAMHYAQRVKAELEVPLDEARALAGVFEAMVNVEGVTFTRRRSNMILKYFIENNPDFLGVYVAFEPDAFDGKDANFIGEAGHDETGRFIPYWTLDSEGKGVLEPLVSYEVEGDGDYYLIPKKTKREAIIDPYLYTIQGEDVMLTSLVVPILDSGGNSFLGIAGLDISLESLQEMVEQIKIPGFPGATVTLFSSNGMIVADSDRQMQGVMIGDVDTEGLVTDKILAKESFVLSYDNLGESIIMIGVPSDIGFTGQQWVVSISIPENELFGALYVVIRRLAIISAFCIVVIALFVFFLARSISAPIKMVTEGARRFSIGDFELQGMDFKKFEKINNRGDELGEIGKAFNNLIEYLKEKTGLAENIASGDLTDDVRIASDSDRLSHSLEKMSKSLNGFMYRVATSIEQINTGATQVAQASQNVSQGAADQASSVEEISSSITEISSQAKQNSENASEANGIAQRATENARSGNEQMQTLMTAMEGINASSDEIKKVVKVIDDIAFQINLLALNANVEAARAGKYGKGFAVVADEVRNLAVRSAEAVKETTNMVEESIANIDRGNQAVSTTSDQLTEIVDDSVKVAGLLEEIAAASKEQASGIEEISAGLERVDQITQSNTASSEESASAAEELSSQVEEIRQLVVQFTIKNDTGDNLGEEDYDGVKAIEYQAVSAEGESGQGT